MTEEIKADFKTPIDNPPQQPKRWFLYRIYERVAHNYLKTSDREVCHCISVLATGWRLMPHSHYFLDGEEVVFSISGSNVDRILREPWNEPEGPRRVWRNEIADDMKAEDVYRTPTQRNKSQGA